jgi:signal transduction histidine kinase
VRAGIILAAMLFFVALGADAAGPKRVLILHSFGRDFAPYDAVVSTFRTELAQRHAEPITFVEVSLDSGRAAGEREERAFLEYLKARFDDAAPDVVVTLAAAAARYYIRQRDAGQLPDAPLVIGALDERFARTMPLREHDTVVAVKIEIPQLIDNILRLLPQTQRIAIVGGTSPLERFWLGELRREIAPFEGRVEFEWLNELSLAQMRERLAVLPPRSAVFYGLFVVDAAGVPHERDDALASLHAASNAPMFGVFEYEIGKGVVGGPYSSQRRLAGQITEAALAALRGLATPQPRVKVNPFEPAVYDWRELKRWNIDMSRLPPGSEVRYKRPTIWEQYRVAIIATILVLVLQAGLIMALLIQRIRRRQAEQQARHLGGRILTAQEDERRRLAREMHDDVTQRLAALAIDTAKVQGSAAGSVIGNALDAIRQRLVKLSEDVHALSYRLHPSVIEDLGLVAALRVECNRVTRQEPISVDFDAKAIPRKVPPDTAICLFRVAQEALRNVVRHANASSVEVSLQGANGGIALTVRDDGAGIGEAGDPVKTSLGLVSMRERVRLVGGTLDIVSRPGAGTSVVAWVPLREAA